MINNQAVMLTHIDVLSCRVNTLLVWKQSSVWCPFPSLKHCGLLLLVCLHETNPSLSTTSVLDFFPPRKIPNTSPSGFVHFDLAWQECCICVEKGYPHGYTLTDNTLVVSFLSFASKASCKTLDKSVSFTYFVWQAKPSESQRRHCHSQQCKHAHRAFVTAFAT